MWLLDNCQLLRMVCSNGIVAARRALSASVIGLGEGALQWQQVVLWQAIQSRHILLYHCINMTGLTKDCCDRRR